MKAVVAAMLASVLWPFGNHGETETNRYLIPAWHVDTVRDRFTGRTECRVFQGSRRRPLISYARGTLAFAFPRSRNTIAADFRIDNGPVRPWTTVYPALTEAGATLAHTSMTNPTQGYVILPLGVLEDATTVTIRSRPKDRPRIFSVGGLGDAVASAKRLGCDPDYGFTRPA